MPPVQALLAGKVPLHDRDLDKTRRQTLDAAVPEDERQGQTAKTLEADMLESSSDDLTCSICLVRAALQAPHDMSV